MFENPNPIDAINCLKKAEREALRGDYLSAATLALEASQRLVGCKNIEDSNLREAIRNTVGCPARV